VSHTIDNAPPRHIRINVTHLCNALGTPPRPAWNIGEWRNEAVVMICSSTTFTDQQLVHSTLHITQLTLHFHHLQAVSNNKLLQYLRHHCCRLPNTVKNIDNMQYFPTGQQTPSPENSPSPRQIWASHLIMIPWLPSVL